MPDSVLTLITIEAILSITSTCGWIGKELIPSEAVANLWLNIKNNVFEYQESPIQGIELNNK